MSVMTKKRNIRREWVPDWGGRQRLCGPEEPTTDWY